MGNDKKWRKILYDRQGVADNYVDESFMNELKKNLYTKTYDYWTVVTESGIVTQQICSICMFACTFVYMDQGTIPPTHLFISSLVLAVIGFCVNVCVVYTQQQSKEIVASLKDLTKTTLLFLPLTLILSPILHTLTQTISTDTIYAMTTLSLLLNLFSHNYGTQAPVVSQSVSLNSAIFGTLCLSSRLPSPIHVFTILIFALILFALFPLFRSNFKNYMARRWWSLMTLATTITTLATLATISTSTTILLFLLLIFITFLCPAILVHMQRFKNNIHGPWEEAKIKTHM